MSRLGCLFLLTYLGLLTWLLIVHPVVWLVLIGVSALTVVAEFLWGAKADAEDGRELVYAD